MKFCAPCEAPVVKGDMFNKSQCPRNEVERRLVNSEEYVSAVGSLMYAVSCIRPDISYIVGILGRFQQNPGVAHWKAIKKVLRYLQRTKDFMLVYRRSENLEVVGYSDSDFAGCADSRESTSGYIFLLAGGAVSWKSAKQSLVTTSTMEAEYVAVFELTLHASWLKNFISELKVVNSI